MRYWKVGYHSTPNRWYVVAEDIQNVSIWISKSPLFSMDRQFVISELDGVDMPDWLREREEGIYGTSGAPLI